MYGRGDSSFDQLEVINIWSFLLSYVWPMKELEISKDKQGFIVTNQV
jgi:hypothetical protein